MRTALDRRIACPTHGSAMLSMVGQAIRRSNSLASAFLLSRLGVLFLASLVAQAQEIRFFNEGLPFVLENSPTPRKHMIETMPGGVAAFDFNNDGKPDIFFANGAAIPALRKDGPKYWNRLYRNDGDFKFTDVTEKAGLKGEGYSNAAAAGDFNNDGHVDLFVGGVYHNILYRNRGDGTFEDVTTKSGITSDRWTAAAGWFDFDNDGLLDLFVVNYSKWDASMDRFCGDAARNLRIYCHPKYFEPISNQLFRNRGDGTFEDVTAKSGIGRHRGRGMSVAFADYDGDGFMDAFVTNDNLPNFLFHNKGNGTFEEVALDSGVALNDTGKPVASMGADFRDVDNDGLPDIGFTALFGETFPFFRNLGKRMFQDATYSSKIGSATVKLSGWGIGFFDFNNDGWKDLFTANAHVNDQVERTEPTVYRQRNTVFLNTRKAQFRAVEAGLDAVRAHRGVAFADFDGDGRVDVVVSALGEQAELWRNVSENQNRWLNVKPTGTKSNRDGIGAIVRVAGQTNHMTSAVGYASSSLDGVHFGVGGLQTVDVEVRWPSGRITRLVKVETNRSIIIKEE